MTRVLPLRTGDPFLDRRAEINAQQARTLIEADERSRQASEARARELDRLCFAMVGLAEDAARNQRQGFTRRGHFIFPDGPGAA